MLLRFSWFNNPIPSNQQINLGPFEFVYAFNISCPRSLAASNFSSRALNLAEISTFSKLQTACNNHDHSQILTKVSAFAHPTSIYSGLFLIQLNSQIFKILLFHCIACLVLGFNKAEPTDIQRCWFDQGEWFLDTSADL